MGNRYTLGAAFVVLLATLPAHGQTIKVIRVTGNHALVKMPRGMVLEKDMSYSIASDAPASTPDSAVGAGSLVSRAKSLAATGRISTDSEKSDPGGSTKRSEVEFDLRYGWNKGKMEFGPIASWEWTKSAASSSRRIRAGGFFDFNLVPNTPGTSLVYGLSTTAAFSNIAFSVGSGSESGNGIALGGGGQLKWFGLGVSTAVRLDAQLRYESASVGSIDLTTTGLYVSAGLQAYF